MIIIQLESSAKENNISVPTSSNQSVFQRHHLLTPRTLHGCIQKADQTKSSATINS